MAVWPPADLVDQLRSLPRPERPGLRWTTEAQWHVTLRFLGRMAGPDEVTARLAAMAAGWAGAAPVARAGPSPRRLGDAVWILPVEGLAPMAQAVAAATADWANRRRPGRFGAT